MNSHDSRQKNLAKIEKMAHFESDWNGNGGEKFTTGAIDTFKEVIGVLNRQPDIAPTGRNSLLMRYELANGSSLTFEVTENKAEKVYIPHGDYAKASIQIYVGNVSFKISEAVENFYGSSSEISCDWMPAIHFPLVLPNSAKDKKKSSTK